MGVKRKGVKKKPNRFLYYFETREENHSSTSVDRVTFQFFFSLGKGNA